MFKVVTVHVEDPEFLLMCDNRNCAFTARGSCDLTDAKSIGETQTAFFNAALKDGWAIGWDAQVCPDHSALLQPRNPEKRLVEPATLHQIGNLTQKKSKPS